MKFIQMLIKVQSSNEKLLKYFKTTNSMEIAEQILIKGDLSLNTDQRRKLVEEKKKQISQYINKSLCGPKVAFASPNNEDRSCNE